ncbi:MAG: hypothetical protein RIR80_322 [Bacteroidota bacterium]|jgi:hypothetical protein
MFNMINYFKYHIKKCIFEKNIQMNFLENHQLICLRLALSAAALAIIAIVIHFMFPSAEFSTYQLSLYIIIMATALIAAIVFYFGFKIPIQIQINPADNNARNAYLLSLLMLFTGMITYPSTANRIANFFFLIGTMSFLAGHLLYFIKLVNLKKQ